MACYKCGEERIGPAGDCRCTNYGYGPDEVPVVTRFVKADPAPCGDIYREVATAMSVEPTPRVYPWSNERLVNLTPYFTTFLLEGANVGQLHRMWTEHTAEGQSLPAWLMVCAALVLWWNYYRVQDLPSAKRATAFGVFMNVAVVLSVVYWRYLA